MRKTRKPVITMRFGATANTVTVDGVPFDLNALSRSRELGKFRRLVVGGLTKSGFFATKRPALQEPGTPPALALAA